MLRPSFPNQARCACYNTRLTTPLSDGIYMYAVSVFLALVVDREGSLVEVAGVLDGGGILVPALETDLGETDCDIEVDAVILVLEVLPGDGDGLHGVEDGIGANGLDGARLALTRRVGDGTGGSLGIGLPPTVKLTVSVVSMSPSSRLLMSSTKRLISDRLSRKLGMMAIDLAGSVWARRAVAMAAALIPTFVAEACLVLTRTGKPCLASGRAAMLIFRDTLPALSSCFTNTRRPGNW